MNEKEKEIYMSAFTKSQAGTYDGRKADAKKAVSAHNAEAKGAVKAVEAGIKEGSIRDLARKRMKKID